LASVLRMTLTGFRASSPWPPFVRKAAKNSVSVGLALLLDELLLLKLPLELLPLPELLSE